MHHQERKFSRGNNPGDPINRRLGQRLLIEDCHVEPFIGLGVNPSSQVKFKLSKDKTKMEFTFKGLTIQSLQQLNRELFPLSDYQSDNAGARCPNDSPAFYKFL